MSLDTATRFPAELLRAQVIGILTAWGMPAENAGITAAVMADTDLSAIDSHGISMLMLYEKLSHGGRLDLTATPEVVTEGPSFALVDGHNGLGHPTAVRAMELAIGKARATGAGVVTVRGSSHFGAVGYYARLASEQGLVAIVTTNTRTPTTSATGGTAAVLGTNPICFSAPRAQGEPLVVDISTSVVALNKVKAYALAGKTLPVGWVTDAYGDDVIDSAQAYAMLLDGLATISPLGGPGTQSGGHKGFGLSLMVQVLSAALSGASGTGPRADVDDLGHFFLVIDPEALRPGGDIAGAVEEIIARITEGQPEVLIPGEPELRARAERGTDGIPLPESLQRLIAEICERAGTPYLLTDSPVPVA